MRKPTIKSIIIAVLLSLSVGCQKDDPIYTATEGDYIIYGYSFGMCVGYCSRTIKISGNNVLFEANGRDLNHALPTFESSKNISAEDVANLWNEVDFKSFSHLNAIIGCPDCADGGAEWIEIKKQGSIHKTVFEYGHEPETTTKYIQPLRSIMSSFSASE